MSGRLRLGLKLLLLVISLGGGMWLSYSLPPPAPDVALRIVDGRTLNLTRLRGRPVLVTFWATSCATCVEEIPRLKQLYSQLAPQGLEIVAVAMAYDPPDRVLSLRRRLQIPWPVALDVDGAASRAFGDVPATPAVFLIDPAGRIVEQRLGRLDMARLAQTLQTMLQAGRGG